MPDDRDRVIDVRGLRRTYGRRRQIVAVHDVSFTVGRGEIFGLIGPDGAGKTSIIQTIAAVLTLQDGAVFVNGIDVASQPNAVKAITGYMPQGLGVNLYESLTVDENIEFFRDLRRLPAAAYARNRADLLNVTKLAPFLDRRASQLSGGMRQKLALICTLIHLPDVLLLDEPTTGVDPISRQEFWAIVARVVRERQATVLLSTSYMDEAERCHRVALLHDGAVIASGTPDQVRGRATGQYATIVASPQTQALTILREAPTVTSNAVFGGEVRIQFTGELRDIETALLTKGVTVEQVAIRDATLEDVFLELVESHAPAPAPARLPPRATTAAATVDCDLVTRRFGAFTAVDAVDLHVHAGEIFGLLGPNGAGKTTLIRMMCGLLQPSAGRVRIAGGAFGYMSQRFSLYRDLTVRQNLRLYSDLYAVDRAVCDDMMARLGLHPFASRLARDLPVGVRQRLSLLCAVLHGPSVVFLDEPTSGVDPPARRVFWDLIYALSREAGVTAIVSTHYMDEAAHCDRLGLMDAGRLVAVGSPGDLTLASERRLGSVLAVGADDLRAAHAAVANAYPSTTFYGNRLHVRSRDPDQDLTRLAALLDGAGAGRVRIDPAPLSMDETFIDFIEQAEAARA